MIKIAPGVSWPAVDGEMALHDARDGCYHALNASGAAIWRAFAGGKSFAEIVADLAEVHRVPVETIRQDVDQFVASMRALGLLIDG